MTSTRRCKSDGSSWSICIAAAEASLGVEATQLEVMFPNGICSKRQRTAVKGPETSVRKNAKLLRRSEEGMDVDEFGGLEDGDDPVTEARTKQALTSFCRPRPGATQTRLAEVRAQMARDLNSPVPGKKSKQGQRQPQARCRDLHSDRRLMRDHGNWFWVMSVAWKRADAKRKQGRPQPGGPRAAGGVASTNGETSQFQGAKQESKARMTSLVGAQQKSP